MLTFNKEELKLIRNPVLSSSEVARRIECFHTSSIRKYRKKHGLYKTCVFCKRQTLKKVCRDCRKSDVWNIKKIKE